MASGSNRANRRGLILVALMILVVFLPFATNAADADGDGIEDSVDDCPWASGTSTVDRDGCPDRDNDGTSDFNDGWTTSNPNFQNDFTTSSSSDYNAVDFSPDGKLIVTGSDDNFVRIWNVSTHVNERSVQTGDDVRAVSFSNDGQYVAAGIDDDTINIYYATDLSSVHGSISVDVGGGDQVNSVEFSPDSSLVAVAIGRSGNGGTNGEVKLIKVSDGLQLGNGLNPNGEDRFYDAAFSPDGQFIALAANGDFFIVNVTSRTTITSNGDPQAAVNEIAWSPD
jgi:WD40 repeat protein